MTNAAYIIDYGSYSAGFNKLAHSSCSATLNNENGTYPFENLIDHMASKPTRFTSKNDNIINIDFITDQECDYIGIIGHNLTASATITLENDTTDVYGVPDLDVTIPYSVDEIHYIVTGNDTNRFWKLTISDPNNPTLPFVGEIIMGKLVYFTQNFNWNVVFGEEYKNIHHTTDYGNVWSYYLARTRSVNGMDFVNITDTTAEEISLMYKGTLGGRFPLVMLWDIDSNLDKSVFGKLADQVGRALAFVNVNTVQGLSVQGLPYCKEIDDVE